MSTAQLGGDDRYVLALAGELDLHTAPRVREELGAVLRGGGRYVVLDLRDVSFVDSTMLAVLADAARELRSVHGEVVIVSDDPRVLRPLEITGLDRAFRVMPSMTAAIE